MLIQNLYYVQKYHAYKFHNSSFLSSFELAGYKRRIKIRKVIICEYLNPYIFIGSESSA